MGLILNQWQKLFLFLKFDWIRKEIVAKVIRSKFHGYENSEAWLSCGYQIIRKISMHAANSHCKDGFNVEKIVKKILEKI